MTESVQPSFEALYSQYTPLVRRLLREHRVSLADLEDALQETFIAVHRQLPGFEGRSSLSTWLYAVTWRVAANHRRRQRRMVVRSALEVAADPCAPEAEEVMDSPSLETIGDEQRDLIALHDIGGLSIAGIAELTGHARATVRKKLQRSRAALRRVQLGASPSQAAAARERILTERFARDVPVAVAPELRVLPGGHGVLTTVDDLVLALWRGPCTTPAIEEVTATLLTLARQRPGGIRYLSVIEPASTPPDAQGRDLMLWTARQLKGKAKAIAHLVERRGGLPDIASVMNASILLARAGLDPRYFGELGPTLAWLAQFGELDRERVAEQLAGMKRRLI